VHSGPRRRTARDPTTADLLLDFHLIAFLCAAWMSKCPNCDGVLYTSQGKGYLCLGCDFVAGCRWCRKPLTLNALGLDWIYSEKCLAGACQANGADHRSELARLESEFGKFQSKPSDEHRGLPLSEVLCRWCDRYMVDDATIRPTEEIPPRGWAIFVLLLGQALKKHKRMNQRAVGRAHNISSCNCPTCRGKRATIVLRRM
jgi:hypothetical protein